MCFNVRQMTIMSSIDTSKIEINHNAYSTVILPFLLAQGFGVSLHQEIMYVKKQTDMT